MNTAFHSLWTAEESKQIFHCFQICWFFCFVFNINKDIIELKRLMFRPHIAFYKHHKDLALKALLMGSLPFCLSLNQPRFVNRYDCTRVGRKNDIGSCLCVATICHIWLVKEWLRGSGVVQNALLTPTTVVGPTKLLPHSDVSVITELRASPTGRISNSCKKRRDNCYKMS